MTEYYLSNLLDRKVDRQTKILDIIRSRGFLIDSVGDKFFLSDNAHESDARYLAKGLEDYQLGRTIDDGHRTKKTRREWVITDFRRSYKYESIVPDTIEIVIDEKATIEQAIAMFCGLQIKGGEAGPRKMKWLQYTLELLGPKVELEYLDPYVAFYVKAASACGVYTAASCDGNHVNGGKIYVCADRPSNIWHESIWKYIIQPHFGDVPYIGKGIAYSEQKKAKVFQTVHDIAEFLYENRKEIRLLKQKTVERVTKQFCEDRSYEEISEFYEDECDRILQTAPDFPSIVKGERHGFI